jgi:preprotein translocase subunit SecG
MTAVLVTIHVIVCIALVLIVLLQTGKGASLGAAFGGSTQTVFGATGGSGFFEKMTTVVAIVFMLTSLALTYVSAKRGGESIVKQPAAQEQTAPAEPQNAAPETAQPATPSAAPAPAAPAGGEAASK